jgi:hypothetical protein
MTAPDGSVKKSAQGRLKPPAVLDDDAKRQMVRAARSDERARQLEIGTRVDKHPCVLVAEPEEPELLEPPAHDALILERGLIGLRWVLRRRHTCCNERNVPEFVGRT